MIVVKVLCSDPIRLDRYLKKKYPVLTQGVIQQALRNRDIMLNSGKASSSIRITQDDHLAFSDYFYFNLVRNTPDDVLNKKDYSQSVKKLADKIISEYLFFSCEYFIVINKPSNLAAQGGSKIRISVDDALSYMNESLSKEKQLKLVHRLDKNTCGLLLIAKGYENAARIAKAFRERIISKKYIAIVYGNIIRKCG